MDQRLAPIWMGGMDTNWPQLTQLLLWARSGTVGLPGTHESHSCFGCKHSFLASFARRWRSGLYL